MNIPRRALGFVYKQNTAARSSLVRLTAFLDFTCANSKEAFPVLIDLADKLEAKQFELVVQPFSLPYHRNSHVITQAAHVINKHTNGTCVFPFLSAVFDNLATLETSATRHRTDDQVLEIFVPLATDLTAMTKSAFVEELFLRTYDMSARLDFKYSCTRGVFATPSFMMNDVIIDANATWTVQDWLAIIDPLL